MSRAERDAARPDRRSENPPGLPLCHYRHRHDGTSYRCEAAAGGIVTAEDCRRCAIPEALAHAQACLYLIPLRHDNEARFACPWYFSWAREPAPRDWRELCFCQYWFPRGPDEYFLVEFMSERRARYLSVLRGEEPRGRPLAIPGRESGGRTEVSSPLRQFWRSLRERLGFPIRTEGGNHD
jgi:hypothetical protein